MFEGWGGEGPGCLKVNTARRRMVIKIGGGGGSVEKIVFYRNKFVLFF